MVPRKIASTEEEAYIETGENKTERVERLLAAVLHYLSDEEVEEMDFEYLLGNTEGLQEWWDSYRESNRKHIENDIMQSLGDLSVKELETIRQQIKQKAH